MKYISGKLQELNIFGKEVLLLFLFIIPAVCKLDQLSASKIPPAYWLNSFTHELVLLLGCGIVIFINPRTSLLKILSLLGVIFLVIIDLFIILSNTVYHSFGLFYKHGVLAHMPISNQVNMVISYVTAPLLFSMVQRIFLSFIIALLLYQVWRVVKRLPLRLSRGVLQSGTIISFLLMIFISRAWPHVLDEQELSVWLTFKSFLPKEEIPIEPDRNLLKAFYHGQLGHHKAKVPAPLELPKRDKPYNLIVYSMESTRAISCSVYGGATDSSPFLNSVKGKGIFFEHAYSNSVRSIKSLVPLLLGEYPYFHINSWAWGNLSSKINYGRTLPNILKKKGYFTSFFVNSHLQFDQRDTFLPQFAFDSVEGSKEFISMDDSILVGKLDDLLKKAEAKDQPLFSILLSSAAHSPFKYPEFPHDNGKIDIRKAQQEAVDFGISEVNNYHTIRYPSYLRSIRHQDEVAQLLYSYLKEKDILKDTIFVVLGDHGESFGEHGSKGGIAGHGNSLYEESIKVPLWIHHPDIKPRTISAPVQFIDLVPTWLAMLGIDPGQKYLGRNVLVEPREQLFFSNFVNSKTIGMLDYPFKLIRNGGKKGQFSYELYNLEQDPRERVNLIRNENSVDMKKTLTEFDYFLPSYQKQYIRKKLRMAAASPQKRQP